MKIAIFDLDGTLICGDSTSLFLDCLLDKGIITEEFRKKDDGLIAEFFKGTLDIVSYYHYALTPLIGKNKNDLADIINDYLLNYIQPIVYPEAFKLINEYKALGAEIIIASATIDLIVTSIANKIFNISNIIATRIVYDDKGCITGNVYPDISHQAGKAIRIKELCKQKGWELIDSDGYGDSINDLEMLEITTNPHATNANKALENVAKTRNWEIINFSK
jgi:HAD superfamily hydrolase (TIGR01490 family)